MSEMVDRLARALDDLDAIQITAEGFPRMIALHTVARAAIAAMREPIEAQLAVPFEFFAIVQPWSAKDNRQAFWHAMIDAALK